MLTKEILKRIEEKSKGIHRRFPQLSYDDLYQEGALRALEVLASNPKASFLQVMKAIGFRYIDLIRQLFSNNKRYTQLDEISEILNDGGRWEHRTNVKIDTDEIECRLKKDGDPDDLLTVLLAKDEGLTAREIIALTGGSRITLRSRLLHIGASL